MIFKKFIYLYGIQITNLYGYKLVLVRVPKRSQKMQQVVQTESQEAVYTIYLGAVYEKNHPTQVRYFTWVRPQQNGVFHFVKTNRLYENAFIPPRWDLNSTQVTPHLGGMIFLHVYSFCRAVPPRQNCSFKSLSQKNWQLAHFCL